MKKLLLTLTVIFAAIGAAKSQNYSIFGDDFETGSWAPGWQMNKEVFAAGTITPTSGNGSISSGAYVGGYYPGGMFGPNDVVSGEGGPGQDTYQGKIWPDYDGWAGDWTDNKNVVVNLLVNHVLTVQDIATGGFVMNVDYKFQPSVGPNAGGYAFMALYSPNFSALWWADRVALNEDGSWNHTSTFLPLSDPGAAGANLQFGVGVWSSNYEPNGLYVDNVSVISVPEPSTYALLGLGAAGFGAHLVRRRRR